MARAARIGIEISADACRVVQIDRPGKGDEADTVVRGFTVAPAADDAALAPYRDQHASVVVWGLYADHRQAVVTVGSYQRMRREAVQAARQAGVDTREMVADIAPVAAEAGAEQRRPVVIALARTSEVAAAARPLTAAGINVRSVVTPALALMSLARLRLSAPGAVEAYVALEETRTAIALLRDRALIAAREVEWGYQDGHGHVRSRDDVVTRLGAAVEEFLDDCGARPSAVAQVCVCGGMPELRSMTLALTARLDIEVEPLDTLFGIDSDRLPSDEFRERAAEMRLAWAAAADWSAPINFLRERRRRVIKTTLTRAAIVAGIATGLGIAWRIQRSALLEPPVPAPRKTAAVPVPPRPRPTVPAPSPPRPAVAPPPPTVTRAQPPSASPASAAALQPALAAPPPATAKTQAPRPPAVAPSPTPPPVARVTEAPPQKPVVASPPARLPAPAPAPPPRPLVLTPVPEPARPAPAREPEKAPARPAPAPRVPREEVPLPFEASLGTILYGADRKLAIIDGRIVQVGDVVRGARVVEITPNSVLFRDREGKLRRLSLDDSSR